jgi:hypothetical protein
MKNASILALFFCGMAINLHAQNNTEIKNNPFETKQTFVATNAYDQHIQVAFVALDLASGQREKVFQVDTCLLTAALPALPITEKTPTAPISKTQSIRERYNL